MAITKRYITCFKCKRAVEIDEDKDEGRIFGMCPICKTEYLIRFPMKKENAET